MKSTKLTKAINTVLELRESYEMGFIHLWQYKDGCFAAAEKAKVNIEVLLAECNVSI